MRKVTQVLSFCAALLEVYLLCQYKSTDTDTRGAACQARRAEVFRFTTRCGSRCSKTGGERPVFFCFTNSILPLRFTSTRVQILTPEEQVEGESGRLKVLTFALLVQKYKHLLCYHKRTKTCFASTKVQTLTRERLPKIKKGVARSVWLGSPPARWRSSAYVPSPFSPLPPLP